jgi:hypothetical protein
MANVNLSDAGLQAMGGPNLATSLLTTVVAGAANALGTPVQLFASTPFPASGMIVQLGQTGIAVAAQNSQTLLSIGVGTSGQEQIIAGDIAIGGSLPFAAWHIPIAVGQGQRITAQLRSLVASKSCTMGVSIYGGGGGVEGGYKGVTYGAVTASSRGTILTAAGATNTEAATWTVLTTSTTSRIGWLIVGLASPNSATATAQNGLLDIGVVTSGAGANTEVPIINDIPFTVSANEDINCSYHLTYPVNIPVGMRLSARYRGTSTAAAALPNLTVTGIN